MREQEDNRSPEEIEHDIQRTRAEVSSTIDAIQDRLTPGQMMDQAFAYARTSLPADFGSNLASTVRDNPVPVALIGVGIGWLMMQGRSSGGSVRRRRFTTEYDSDMYATGSFPEGEESAGSKARRMASSVGDKGRELKDQASQTGHDLMDKASRAGQGLMDKASDVGQRLSDTTSSMSDRARDATQRTRERMSGAADQARELGRRSQQQYYQARDAISDMMDDQPLMVGALGLAIGTVLGAMLPGTRREDELMGGSRDSLLDSAKQTAREKAGSFRESAQHVAETAQREVKSAVSQVAGSAASGDGNAKSPPAASQDTSRPDQQRLH